MSFLLDIGHGARLEAAEKALATLFRRPQRAIVRRRQKRGSSLSRPEKLLFTALVDKLKRAKAPLREQFGPVLVLFQPETVLRWHRQLLRKQWTFPSSSGKRGGRPKTDTELEALVVRRAHENDWGRGKLPGELQKLGCHIGETTLRAILRRHGIPPARERKKRGTSGRACLKHDRHPLLACACFTVETLRLHT